MKKTILLLAAMMSLSVSAQQNATPHSDQRSEKWTLEDCIRYAIENNITLKKSQLSKRRYYEQQEKILTRKVMPQLTRAARTNRLCIRAGMLESFLEKPELLSNDQVMQLMKIAFQQKPVQEALQSMLANAGVTGETEET